MICKICAALTNPFANAQMLDKYEIQYFQCPNCGFIQTEEPFWLDEAYAEAITNSDIGLIGRNVSFATITQAIITAFFDRRARFLDYGGGYGLFVRLMRDQGFDFYRYDKFCANLFAKGFDADIASPQQYELVTALEVFEHLVNPLAEIEQLLTFSKNVLFSTILIPPGNPRPNEWWYYGLDHGQHVALYTQQSLKLIAKRFQLNLYTNGTSLHLLTNQKVSPFWFNGLSRYKVARLLSILASNKSRLADDYYQATGKHLN